MHARAHARTLRISDSRYKRARAGWRSRSETSGSRGKLRTPVTPGSDRGPEPCANTDRDARQVRRHRPTMRYSNRTTHPHALDNGRLHLGVEQNKTPGLTSRAAGVQLEGMTKRTASRRLALCHFWAAISFAAFISVVGIKPTPIAKYLEIAGKRLPGPGLEPGTRGFSVHCSTN